MLFESKVMGVKFGILEFTSRLELEEGLNLVGVRSKLASFEALLFQDPEELHPRTEICQQRLYNLIYCSIVDHELEKPFWIIAYLQWRNHRQPLVLCECPRIEFANV